jgi:hypothetical protein
MAYLFRRNDTDAHLSRICPPRGWGLGVRGQVGLAELEVESTAYVVCQPLELECADYSFGYVATWPAGGDEAIAGIKASCDRIQKTAPIILARFVADETEEVA